MRVLGESRNRFRRVLSTQCQNEIIIIEPRRVDMDPLLPSINRPNTPSDHLHPFPREKRETSLNLLRLAPPHHYPRERGRKLDHLLTLNNSDRSLSSRLLRQLPGNNGPAYAAAEYEHPV